MRDQTRIMGEDVRFHTTSWSLVRSSRNLEVLNALVGIYWKPLYFFVRQQGHDNETAKDIVQEFVTTLIERDAFLKADPARGRFRTFLLSALGNFLKDRARGLARGKRGGGQALLSIDVQSGEKEFVLESRAGEAPERVLGRAWARTLWSRSMADLEGDPAHLEAFRMYLRDAGYEEICARTGLSVAAAKVAVHRLKQRLRDVLLGYLARTAADDAELRADLAEFKALLAGDLSRTPW
jgi:RNA polymerase sigma factor (sigma-70 family)